MPLGLERRYGKGGLHFLTFSCYRRLPLLGTAFARNVFVDALSQIRKRYGFGLVGYVVMPDHVHLLIYEATNSTPSDVLKALKQRVSRDLRNPPESKELNRRSLAFTKRGEELPRFWQARFYDFNVYTNEKKKEKLIYMHGNPVT